MGLCAQQHRKLFGHKTCTPQCHRFREVQLANDNIQVMQSRAERVAQDLMGTLQGTYCWAPRHLGLGGWGVGSGGLGRLGLGVGLGGHIGPQRLPMKRVVLWSFLILIRGRRDLTGDYASCNDAQCHKAFD